MTLKRPKVILVEDDGLVALPLVDDLDDAGFEVLHAPSSKKALQLIDATPDLVALVTDIRLGPPPDGWVVARHARGRWPSIAVVYMSGDSAAAWTAEGVPKSLMLSKPFASAQLVTAVSQLINEAGDPTPQPPPFSTR
jgi:DNA-binding response OmpR family regulator